MNATTQDMFNWLKRRYCDFKVCDTPLHGTYGLIWFLSNDSGSFAVKTLAPERLEDAASQHDGEYLRREFRMWLTLPTTYNVLPALGFDVANIFGRGGRGSIELPVMRMPRRLGSLHDWIESASYSYEDRLVALAQAFNGLLYLYDNGIEGHGDLKPSNILFDNLNSFFQLKKDGAWPNTRCPWRIQVADLGWANAWIDLGFTKKAQREYMAPERIGGEFIPSGSDVFSMGVIAAELLQGRHPCPHLSKALRSEGKWIRWVNEGERDLQGVASVHIKEMILQCLRPNAYERPTPDHCLGELCNEIDRVLGYSIKPTLDLWRRPTIGSEQIAADEHFAWASVQSIKLNEEQAAVSRAEVSTRLSQILVTDFASCEHWLVLAEGLEKLLEIDCSGEDALAELRQQAYQWLREILGRLTPEKIRVVPTRDDRSKLLRPYERFSETITGMARLAGVKFDNAQNPNLRLEAYALSALAFGAASEARASGLSLEEQLRFLEAAIHHSPEEAVPYYFRARWGHEEALMQNVLSKKIILEEERESWITDLKMALMCDPTWAEPVQLLESVTMD